MRFTAWVAVLAGACDSEFWHRDKDKDGSTPDYDRAGDAADADADTDADSDADTDADSDADTDTGTASDLDCNADYLADTPLPGSTGLGSCITQELFCGDEIYATNTGGSTNYAHAYWEDQFLTGPYLFDTTVFDGPERCYVFRGLQEGQTVDVRVESCMDVWATWIRYGDIGGEFCDLDPFNQAGIWEGSAGTRERWTRRINTESASGYDFEFQIEGIFAAEGNFKLTVECF